MSKGRFLVLFLGVCALLPSLAWAAGPQNVLVIVNDNSPASKAIGAYYAAKRKIPSRNICHIKCADDQFSTNELYRDTVEKPVKAYLAKTGLNKSVDYLVLTKGLPIRLHSGWAVDSILMVMDHTTDFSNPNVHARNPYFGKTEHFSHAKYGFYLATRLDGYSVSDAKALVDRSLAAKPSKGLFLIDTTPKRNTSGYATMNERMAQAYDRIVQKGAGASHEDTSDFVGGKKNLMGYFSWGSNDADYDVARYKSNRFLPGAIAETAVSTSARTFYHTKLPGQSLIADLIESGVTGVKGYVNEPTLAAIADPVVLFDRYLSGYNLAESFYMASRFIFWRDIVVGDPLCAPYAAR